MLKVLRVFVLNKPVFRSKGTRIQFKSISTNNGCGKAFDILCSPFEILKRIIQRIQKKSVKMIISYMIY